MSTETVAPDGVKIQSQTAGGSPGSAEDAQNTGAQASDVSSETQEGGGEDPSAELARTRSELQQLRERAETLDGLRQFIDSDPDLRERVLRKINGQPAPDAPARGWARVEKTLGDAFEDSPQSRALSGALKAAFEEAVNEAVSRLEPEVRGVKAVMRGTQFEKSLHRHGVPADIQESPAFASVLKEQRSKRSFRFLEQDDPDYAAQILADTWRARAGTRDAFAAERRRVEAAKGGGLTKTAPRGSATANETVKVRKGDLVGLRALFAKGLTREQIELTE